MTARQLREDDVPVVGDRMCLVDVTPTASYLRVGDRSLQLDVPSALLRPVLDAVDGTRTVREVCEHVASRVPPSTTVALLHGLAEIVITVRPQPSDALGLVAVAGDGPLAHACSNALTGVPGVAVVPEPTGTPYDVDIVVCAFAGVPAGMVLDINRSLLAAATTAVFVTTDTDGVRVAPPTLPGRTACYECERLATLFGEATEPRMFTQLLPGLFLPPADPHDPSLRRAADRVAESVRALLAGDPQEGLFTQLYVFGWNGLDGLATLVPRPECSSCDAARRSPTDGDAGAEAEGDTEALDRAATIDLLLAVERARASAQVAAEPLPEDAYRRVCVLGGGTAGYLAALALRTKLPHLDVTLIESQQLGVIGVGEATTPRLVEYLHLDLGIDVAEFHARVRPAWKLGVHYAWGLPGDYAFPWPFQYGALAESIAYDGNLDSHCLGAQLMLRLRAPVLRLQDGHIRSLVSSVPFAYHLDNRRFVAFLQDQAERAGVRRLDRTIRDVTCTTYGHVDKLVTDDGERLGYDFYIDSSGFRSVLLEQTLGSRFLPYSSSLLTDSAVVANVPHDGRVKPYTLAETMHSGWCWNIAFEEEDHRGYVFASDFSSVDEAAKEMRARNPGMGESWSLRFRSGRHEHFLLRNVAAVGNAYAFVEPLASTSIHMLLMELDILTRHFPVSPRHTAAGSALNAHLGGMWDALRGWLAVQYRFNRKYDTEFWRHCRAHVDLAGAEAYVERFRESAPLTSGSPALVARPAGSGLLPQYAVDYFGQDYVYDIMLVGQQVPANLRQPSTDQATWQRRSASMRAAASWGLPHAEALQLARERPEILEDISRAAASWSEGMRP